MNNLDKTELNAGPSNDSIEGFPFHKRSAIRCLAEPASFVLFPYIAGLTVMDDVIAAAVGSHSTFQAHPLERLFGTINAAIVLVFGNANEVRDMAMSIHAFHSTVHGDRDGVTYHANNIDSQIWVLAAVFQGMVEARRRFSSAVYTIDEERELYLNFKSFAHFFGIDRGLMPKDINAFKDYWEERMDGSYLLNTQISREMSRAVFRFSGTKNLSPLWRVNQAISIASLDQRLLIKSGLELTEKDRQISEKVDFLIRHTYGYVPRALRAQVIPVYMVTRRLMAPVIKVSKSNNKQ